MLAKLNQTGTTPKLHDRITDFDLSDPFIVCAGSGNSVKVYNQETQKVTKELKLDFQPTMTRILPFKEPQPLSVLVAGSSPCIEVWDAVQGSRKAQIATNTSHTVSDISFQPLNDYFVFS